MEIFSLEIKSYSER